MNVRVTKRAQAQIDWAALWWDENRDRAPEAFDEDLAEAFLLLSAEPGVGAPVIHARAQGVRRLHLARIRYHLPGVAALRSHRAPSAPVYAAYLVR